MKNSERISIFRFMHGLPAETRPNEVQSGGHRPVAGPTGGCRHPPAKKSLADFAIYFAIFAAKFSRQKTLMQSTPNTMKRILILFISVLSYYPLSAQQPGVVNLQCQYQEFPLGVDEASPPTELAACCFTKKYHAERLPRAGGR